jgi:hypothetical protein
MLFQWIEPITGLARHAHYQRCGSQIVGLHKAGLRPNNVLLDADDLKYLCQQPEYLLQIKKALALSISDHPTPINRLTPVGLRSRQDARNERIKEIAEAVSRYIQADEAVPPTWLIELADLLMDYAKEIKS